MREHFMLRDFMTSIIIEALVVMFQNLLFFIQTSIKINNLFEKNKQSIGTHDYNYFHDGNQEQ